MSGERSLVFITVAFQLVISIVTASIWFVTKGSVTGYSAIVGGIVHIIPYLVASLISLAHKAKDESAYQLVMDVYLGVFAKIALTVILFALVYIYMDIHIISLYVTYLLSIFTQWIVSIFYNNRY
ncbi:ATP synthase subunit I [Vibrio sp. SS-MA-C1-2]|uniref:ATP synthase subunit I n=1 Tax=Vibrio sp. SS-MA-C1-2 TaxID=2908646 RepID=UPI001F240313|nr:ATP synthase subunit I [Vibrio sp. SS-MA-C1-2]UJF19333.1 ATP synthase subunit I [Vibrio sp. SS-MA-C1-2]